MSLVIKFYFTSSMLNMFRTLIQPSSGACDFSMDSPHWSCVLVSMCVGLLFFNYHNDARSNIHKTVQGVG